MPTIASLDHLVLTVADIDRTARFYETVLGVSDETFHPADGSVRTALKFGGQKINLHQTGREFDPKADRPTAGSADLCFLSADPLTDWQDHFDRCGVTVVAGPVNRTGANGPIRSLYVRDPDGNLIEVSNAI